MRPVVVEAPAGEFPIHLSPSLLVVHSSRTTPPIPTPTPKKCDAQTCPWWPYSNSKDFKINAAVILVILFCALLCALGLTAAIRYLLRSRSGRRPPPSTTDDHDDGIETRQLGVVIEHDRGQYGRHPKQLGKAPKVVVAPPDPVLVFSTGMKLAGAEAECTICLSEFVEGERIRVLDTCNHGFHLSCIHQWLTSHSSCPTCRASCCYVSRSASCRAPL